KGVAMDAHTLGQEHAGWTWKHITFLLEAGGTAGADEQHAIRDLLSDVSRVRRRLTSCQVTFGLQAAATTGQRDLPSGDPSCNPHSRSRPVVRPRLIPERRAFSSSRRSF